MLDLPKKLLKVHLRSLACHLAHVEAELPIAAENSQPEECQWRCSCKKAILHG